MNFTVPNLLSLLRMALIPLFIIALLDGQPRRALVVFAVAGVTDLLDGLIARFLHQQSVLGMYLDPIADKLLLTSAYVMLAVPGLQPGALIPIWVTVLVIARDVVIVVVTVILHLALKIGAFRPSVLSKMNTVAQVTTVIAVLLSGFVAGLELFATTCIYVVAALTLGSGLDYIYRANCMVAQREEGVEKPRPAG